MSIGFRCFVPLFFCGTCQVIQRFRANTFGASIHCAHAYSYSTLTLPTSKIESSSIFFHKPYRIRIPTLKTTSFLFMPRVTQADDHVGAGSFGEVRRPVDTTNNSTAGAKTREPLPETQIRNSKLSSVFWCHHTLTIWDSSKKMGGGVDDFFKTKYIKVIQRSK